MTACIADKLEARSPSGIADSVRAILSAPEDRLDYARAKLALDALVDPSSDPEATMAELDRMARKAKHLAGPGADSSAKLDALRKLIYASGPWNWYRPFAYDHSNVRGANIRVKLISHYLETRLGDCVSMPILFLILADKLGLDIALASAPNHLFLRHRQANGHVVNLEATSGAMPARDIWLRQVRPMSDRSIETGLYMRTLSRREGIAAMAISVLQYLGEARLHEETIAAAEAILEHNPRDGLTLANLGNAYERMMRRDFLDSYGSPLLVPIALRPRYQFLWSRNHAAFAKAKALGWEYCL